jgi:hypothetical protein
MAALLSLGLGTSQANADEAVRLLPGGVVYPEYNSEGVMNPATLNTDDARLARVLLDANIFGSSTQGLGLDYTMTWPKFGFDFGYDTYRTVYTGLPAGDLSHTLHGAAGYRMGPLGIGLSYTHYLSGASASYSASSASTGTSGELDFGLAYTTGKLRMAMVIEGLSSTPSATLGIGVQEENSHAVEFNLAIPPLSAGLTSPGATYTATLALSLYLNTLGVGYTTNYSYAVSGASGTVGTTSSSFLNSPLGFSHAFSLLLRITKTGSLSFRFDPNDYLTLGLTLRI